jgi:hypothetical protein
MGRVGRVSILFGLTTLLLVSATITMAQSSANNPMGRHYITKTQEALLKKSIYATRDYADNGKNYRPYVDFDRDCGISGSVENLQYHKKGERTFLIEDASNLKERLVGYPRDLTALGKNDSFAQVTLSHLGQYYKAVEEIANGTQDPVSKVRAAAPYLTKATSASQDLARHAGFDYEGGCGAGPEDSEPVVFQITPKPNAAYYILDMDFDNCKAVLADPFDVKKCEYWDRIHSNNDELVSGTYKYQVLWNDGGRSTGKFSAMSKGRKMIPIERD